VTRADFLSFLKRPWGKRRDKGVVDRLHYEASGMGTGGGPTTAEAFPKQPGQVNAELASRIYANSPYVNAAVRVLADQLATVLDA
jgi:hypothetical protein